MTHAKVILFGEHAVVYGKKGIGIPLKSLNLKACFVKEKIYESDHLVFIKKLIEKTYSINTNLYIKIESNIPISAGLGSSSALAIEVAKLYSKTFNKIIDIKFIADIAENKAHNNPSGIDVNIILNSKSIIFQKSMENIEFNFKLNAFLIIVNTNLPKNTAKSVNIVKENFIENEKYIENIGKISEKAIISLKNKDVLSIGKLMNEAQLCLKKMKLSNNRIDKLIEIANYKAIGSKITGAGLGGCFIALAKNINDANIIMENLKKEGIKEIWIEAI